MVARWGPKIGLLTLERDGTEMTGYDSQDLTMGLRVIVFQLCLNISQHVDVIFYNMRK